MGTEGREGDGGPYRVMPLLVAMMRTGERSVSSARFRKEKHSMSSICTSSMNNTCQASHNTSGQSGRNPNLTHNRVLRQMHTPV